MVFPGSSLTVPSGGEFRNYGPLSEVDSLEDLLARSDFELPSISDMRKVGADRESCEQALIAQS